MPKEASPVQLLTIVSLKRQKNRCPIQDSESVIRLRFRAPSARSICHRAVHLPVGGATHSRPLYRGRISRTFIYLRHARSISIII